MQTEKNEQRIHGRVRFEAIGLSLAALVGLIALLVLIGGWGLGIGVFQRIRPGLAAMVPSTAFCFLVAALAVTAAFGFTRPRRRLIATQAAAVFIGGFGLLDLAIIGFTGANGIDRFFLPGIATFRTDSMAIGTATSFLLLAISLWRLSYRQPDTVSVISSTAGLLLSGIALVGYAFDSTALYEVSVFTAMSLHTAAAFLLIFSGLLLLKPNTGWMGVLLGEGGGSHSARRLVPGAVILPFLLCLIALWATEAGLVNSNFRLSVLAIAMMFLLSASALYFATVQNRIQARLKVTVADRELLLREVYHRVKNNLQMTTSLLRMGKTDTADARARETLDTTIRRVEAIGTVHRILIAARVPSDVRAEQFVDELADNILRAKGDDKNITIERDVGDFKLHVDRAVTIGLLLNEIVTNSLKHGFAEREDGLISVYFHREPAGPARLIVSDNGAGMEEDRTPGTGTRIIRALTGQLGAEMDLHASGGTRYEFAIPAKALDGGRYE